MLGLFTKWGRFTARGVAVLPLRNPAVQLSFLQVWFSSVKISSTELFYWSKISWEYSPEYNPGSWSKTDFQIHAIILTLIDLGTVGLDMSCLKSRTKSGHLLFWMIMLIIMLAAETYLAFGLRKRQLMSHMNGPSRGLIATCVTALRWSWRWWRWWCWWFDNSAWDDRSLIMSQLIIIEKTQVSKQSRSQSRK